MPEISFDALIAKRAQREKDKTKICKINIPNTDDYLMAIMPSDYKILQWLGMMNTGNTDDRFAALDDAIYTCCPALQDNNLREQIGAKVPTDVVPMLFSIGERNQMGEPLFKFVGIFKSDEDNGENEEDNKVDIVKN